MSSLSAVRAAHEDNVHDILNRIKEDGVTALPKVINAIEDSDSVSCLMIIT